MNTPAASPASSATVNINGTCYTGSPGDTFQAFGDSAKMGMSIGGIILTCICCSLFAYMATTSTSALPKIMAVCCICSLVSSIWQYFNAKMDIDSLKTSGKIRNC